MRAHVHLLLPLLFGLLLGNVSCFERGAQTRAPTASTSSTLPSPLPDERPWPEAGKVIAIGDLHGDLNATKAALRLAGAIDEANRWTGGRLVVVQLGDQIDRADDDRAVIDFIERLMGEANAAGGALYPLLGNHEVMVAQGDVRYVTEGAIASFADLSPTSPDAELLRVPKSARGHRFALRPGGPYARKLARRNLAMRVGDTLFVHGGLMPKHAAHWRKLNADTRRWLAGVGPLPPHFQTVPDERPLWSRHYSFEPSAADCALLAQTLAAFGAKRMVVAHTVQPRGVSAACEGKVWRTDAGMSRAYGGPIEILELTATTAQVLRAPSPSRRHGADAR